MHGRPAFPEKQYVTIFIHISETPSGAQNHNITVHVQGWVKTSDIETHRNLPAYIFKSKHNF